MDPGIIIGVLAVFTIGSVLLLSIGHFGFFLRDPKNRFQVANILAGGESAVTVAGRSDPSVSNAPLKTRLDQSIASSHPADPAQSQTRAERAKKFSSEKVG